MSGAWVFKGTRVPVSALFKNLESGARVDDFVEWFEGTSKDQVEAVLEFARTELECSMKILFDQCVPQPLRGYLKGHAVFTANELGWGRLRNGELLNRAERDGFDCLLTADQNLKYQQNLAQRKIAIFVVKETDWKKVKLRAADIAVSVSTVQPGTYNEFDV